MLKLITRNGGDASAAGSPAARAGVVVRSPPNSDRRQAIRPIGRPQADVLTIRAITTRRGGKEKPAPGRPAVESGRMDLFRDVRKKNLARAAPLAVRMRPRTLEEFVGQAHFLGPGKLLRR